jgi:hypothetical protein
MTDAYSNVFRHRGRAEMSERAEQCHRVSAQPATVLSSAMLGFE